MSVIEVYKTTFVHTLYHAFKKPAAVLLKSLLILEVAVSKMNTTVVHRNNVKVLGKGTTPMLFAHGFGCDQNMWQYITPAFEEDYQVILFDYTGSGNSDADQYNKEKYGSLKGYAQDVLDIIIALDVQEVIFVGHSVSCMIGVLAYIKHPHLFDRFIMVSPSPRYINDEGYIGGFDREEVELLLEQLQKDYPRWATAFAGQVMGNPDKPELTEKLRDSFCAGDPAIAQRFATVTLLADNRGELAELTIPTLILQCSDDVLAPEEVGKFVHEQIEGSTLRIMKATGHCPNLSAPEETISLMKEFLK